MRPEGGEIVGTSADVQQGSDGPDDAPGVDRTTGPAAGSTTVPDAARAVAAVAMLGAAVIHFAYAPEHLDAQTSHGVFFLVVAWLQLVGAAALVFRWRPQPSWLRGTAALNGAVAALWLLTRTAGLPDDEPEAVGFPDALASALEVVAAAAALAIGLRWLAERPVGRPAFAVTGLPTAAVVALVTAAVIPGVGGDHTHDDGVDAGTGELAAGASASATGHDDHGTTDGADDWNAQRIAALEGYLPDDEVERHRQIHVEYLSEQIRNRSRTLGDLPEAEREATITAFAEWSVDNALTSEAPPDDGEATMHSHGVDEWQPITDPDDLTELQAQLQEAGTVIPHMSTAADAVDAGYMQVTPYVPGIGAHYLNIDLLQGDGFDPGKPEMLLYNGNEPTSELIGLSYAVLADEAPEGFVGPNDSWHRHIGLCIVGALVVGPESTPEEDCESIGGRKGMGFDKPMWMGHLWQVPGWESPWGLFSGENPVINLATSDVGG